MKAILSEVGRVRAAEGGGRYVMEQSPVGCSASKRDCREGDSKR